MTGTRALRIRLTIRERVVREYEFHQDVIAIGRDPACDVVLDNAGISRNHSRIERSPAGWEIFDEGSVNGTWLNEQRVRRGPLSDGDVVRIGKFSLAMSLSSGAVGTPIEPEFSGISRLPERVREADGTTVLTRGQLARVLAAVRETEEQAEVEPPAPRECLPWVSPQAGGKFPGVIVLVLGVLMGALLGAIAVYFFFR